MPKIIVVQPFKFAHHGYQVEEFEPSPEPRDTTDECAALAIAEGWAEDADQLKAERQAAEEAARAEAERQAAELTAEKAEPATPVNKDAAPKRSTKTAA